MKNKIKKSLIISALALMSVILISACKEAVPPPNPPDQQPPQELIPAPEEIEVRLDVQVDFGILTPFVPQHTLHTRLNEGAIPKLIPANDYGTLLPYSSAVMLDDGSLEATKFGFVTIDGLIVTDLIYDGIERAEYVHNWYVGNANDMLPAYKLFLLNLDPETPWDFYNNRKMAACALDGSWITGFDYIDIVFTRDVILLYRDELTFDIDVIDYSGKRLFNMLDLSWAREARADPLTGRLIEIIDDRYAHIRIRTNTYAFLDLLTGSIRSTRFIGADPFIDGYAPVGVGIPNTYFVIWGLINENFDVVIQPRYYNLPFFKYGQAIVQRRDESQYVINVKGEVLFNVPDNYWIDHSNEGPTFILYSKYGSDPYPTFLTSDFKEIIPPEGVMKSEFNLRYLNNGWYTTGTESGSHLYREDEMFYFPGVEYIEFFDGSILLYGTSQEDADGYTYISGVMTIDGEEIISPEPDTIIIPVIQNGAAIAFIIRNESTFSFPEADQNPNTFKLVDTDGSTKIQGRGMLTYHNALGLYSIQGENHYSWLDKDAKPIISIPLMSSLFD